MQAKALVCCKDRRFALEDVILPDPGPDRVHIRTLRSGVSIGTEFALIRNEISWGPYPLCVGYQAVGVIEEVGEQVEGFAVGDIVYFRDNRWMQLPDGTTVSCVSGTHCSHAVVDPGTTHGIAHLPDGVDLDSAALFVMPAVALYGVDMANVRMGSTVVVYGCGQIGLGVVGFCVRRGAVTIAVDIREDRLRAARAFGADHVVDGGKQDVASAVHEVVPGGADVVFEATGRPQCVDPALQLVRAFGKFVLQGNYGSAPVSFHFLPPHGKRLTWLFPCDDGLAPCRRAVMKNLALGALDWSPAITHRVSAGRIAEFYGAINCGEQDDVIGAVVNWETL